MHARARALAHQWYHLARWKHPRYGLRIATLRRHPLCEVCRTLGLVTASTDVDHILPHHGDPILFWDPTNLQGLCKRHHTEKTRRGE